MNTLTAFLKITARDGETLRISSGSRNYIVDGEKYYPYPLDRTQIQETNGLDADNLEIVATYAGLWNRATVRAQKWYDAEVLIFVKNFSKNIEIQSRR